MNDGRDGGLPEGVTRTADPMVKDHEERLKAIEARLGVGRDSEPGRRLYSCDIHGISAAPPVVIDGEPYCPKCVVDAAKERLDALEQREKTNGD